ncbi:hypothetical protein E5288_WYG005819 [Bos mutus]|uniref:Uncharacterized protein n=1 Tax=Bos mutus TaxID=72004 RepID=A0A6B0QXG4_9CETA|nr:hypothetical protein [Bos mutus]
MEQGVGCRFLELCRLGNIGDSPAVCRHRADQGDDPSKRHPGSTEAGPGELGHAGLTQGVITDVHAAFSLPAVPSWTPESAQEAALLNSEKGRSSQVRVVSGGPAQDTRSSVALLPASFSPFWTCLLTGMAEDGAPLLFRFDEINHLYPDGHQR